MVGFREAFTNAVADYTCRVMTNSEAPDNLIQRTVRSIPGGAGAVDRLTSARNAMRDFACDPNRPQTPQPGDVFPPQAAPQYSGGQCDTRYDVSIVGSYDSAFFGDRRTTSGTARVQGPTGDAFFVEGNNIIEWFIQTPTGDVLVMSITESLGNVSNAAIDSVTPVRVDGLPDDCGDIGAPPQALPFTNVPVTYDGPDGLPVTVDTDIIVQPPVLDAGGNLIIPFGVAYLDVVLEAEVDLNIGEVNLIFGGGGPDSSPCCPAFDEPENPVDDPVDEPPEPVTDERFVAVRVIAQSEPENISATEIFSVIGPNVLVPRIGILSFAMEIGGLRSWSVDFDIRKRNQFVLVPDGYTAYFVDLIADPGWTFTLERVVVAE